MLRRSPLKRKSWLGRASRKRVRAGGVLAKGRQSATLAGWREIVAQLRLRAQGRCENPLCRRPARLDPHHVLKRSQGGADALNNLVALCRRCHVATDLPFGPGRLSIVKADSATQGASGFGFLLERESISEETTIVSRAFLPD